MNSHRHGHGASASSESDSLAQLRGCALSRNMTLAALAQQLVSSQLAVNDLFTLQ
jgi:hypothetical protein